MKDTGMLERLFFKLLPVQILIVAMGSVNLIVDGAVAGRCIDASTVGVVGLYYPMVNALNAVGAVLLGGAAVLCGRSMGSGDIEKTRSIFTMNLSASLAVGALLTAVSLLMPGAIADLLGASRDLRPALITYIRGYAIGVIPMLTAQQVAAFLQMERQSARGYAGIAGMVISNIAFDIILVVVFDMGIWGLALATSLSNWIYLIILAPYYYGGRSQLRMGRKYVNFGVLGSMIAVGVPGAVLVFTLAVRGIVINRILLTYAGSDGLSAQSAYNMISGLFYAFALGTGATVRMLASVFYGEEDRDSLRRLLVLTLKKGLPVSLAVTAAVLLISGPVTAVFFPDRTSEVYDLTRKLFMIGGGCVPLIVLCQIVANYLQACGHNLYVNILSVFDGFFAMVIPSVILAPSMGAMGVWIANPIGIILTLLLSLGYACVFNRRFPRGEDFLMLRKSFGVPQQDRLDIPIHSISDVAATSEKVQEFCAAHGLDGQTSYYAALCLEEMAGNVVDHGFIKDNKNHMGEAHVVIKDGRVMLRLKDDCIPFDPMERAEQMKDDDPLRKIGIRMVMKIARDITYQNLMGLNVLTIRL